MQTEHPQIAQIATPRIVPVGLTGLLVTFSDQLTPQANRAALAFRAAVEALALNGVSETTTSLTSAFVIHDPHILPRDQLRAHLDDLLQSRLWSDAPLPQARKLWHIPAVFDGAAHGPQLAEAADLAGVDIATAVREICETTLQVLTIGFGPGVPYLGSLPENWNIPRQTALTKQVPAGAITVAIRQIVLFPAPSPTGWRHVGQCAFRGFRPERDDPFTLTPGDQIRFRAVSADALADIRSKDQTGDGGATWEALP